MILPIQMEAAVRNAAPQNLKSIFEYSAKEMEQTFQVDWGWKEKLGWWVARKRIKKAQKRALNQALSQIEAVDDTICYTIQLKDGSLLFARDIKIKSLSIYYTDCAYPTQRKWVKKEKIDYVMDLKGNIVYDKSMMPDPALRKTESWSLVGLMLMLFSVMLVFAYPTSFFILTGVIGALFGLIGFARAMIHPAEYKNKWVAVISLLFALLVWGSIIGVILAFA